jgi:ribose transport system ATP-binding protein
MLIANNISKSFAGVQALSGVHLSLQPGMVHAIIGENGAGKSTLMKILSGVIHNYEGQILLNDKPVQFNSTRDAEAAGIAMIHQELNLVPQLSVVENIFLGREITDSFGMLAERVMYEASLDLLKRVGLSVDPGTKIETLKVGQQQLVEIAKALHTKASIIIMDEPTSALSDTEIATLFTCIHELTAAGATVVYISHKLQELYTIANTYVVLRDGVTVANGAMKDISETDLIAKMSGRNTKIEKINTPKNFDTVLLEVNDLYLKHATLLDKNALSSISFQIHKGEIVGIYGLMGAGRTELLECLFGLHPKRSSGNILLDGKKLNITSPATAIAAGMALVPEDRKTEGLLLEHTVRSNMSLTVLDTLEKFGIYIDTKPEKELSKKFISELSIKTASDTTLAKNLSGGNQQKIVLAKWLATNPKILLLDEPTRGIDVNAKAEIYALIKSLAVQGLSVVLVSSEIPEIMAVSDRVLVMANGKFTANMPISEANESLLLKKAL